MECDIAKPHHSIFCKVLKLSDFEIDIDIQNKSCAISHDEEFFFLKLQLEKEIESLEPIYYRQKK